MASLVQDFQNFFVKHDRVYLFVFWSPDNFQQKRYESYDACEKVLAGKNGWILKP